MDNVLELVGADVRLGGSLVLKGLDFHVAEDEFVVLLGGNGSGKTTLVRACLGLVPLDRGRASAFGAPLERARGWDRVGYVPQRVDAISGVPATVSEVVLSGRSARRRMFTRITAADRDAARRALDAVDLADRGDQAVARLSGGQQQRVLIARALARDPEVLILDEPVASVDLAHQETFAGTLSELRRRGAAVLLVAHALGAMEGLIDRAVALERGRVVYDGPPARASSHVEEDHHHHPHVERAGL